MTTLSQIQSKIMSFKSLSSAKVPIYLGLSYEDIEANDGLKVGYIPIVYNGENPEIQLTSGEYQNEVEKITIYVTSTTKGGDVIEESRLLSRELAGYSFTDDLSELRTLYFIGSTPMARVGTNEQTIQLDFECRL